jgi:hypothetical protein
LGNANDFIAATPTTASCWRAIVLFGRNVASYKFALAESLLALPERGSDLVKLEELAGPFAEAVCRHLTNAPKQGTSQSSAFLDACRSFNSGESSKEQLRESTSRLGFVNVIDAFHVVNQGEVPVRFFIDERGTAGGIRLTDELLSLRSASSTYALSSEIEARWRLVETAWACGVGRRLVTAEAHAEDLRLVIHPAAGRRLPVTSARGALNGYQKGLCFYCYRQLALDGERPNSADVDHFLPHMLRTRGVQLAVDGVWNLVLACRDCNRGEGGKFARVPEVQYLERLSKRNEYYVNSHHPLRETIIAQTGATAEQRRGFLRDAYRRSLEALVHPWSPRFTGDGAL